MRVEVDIACKAFNTALGQRREVLKDIAFALEPGEVGVFVGPSGCGKTTLLRIVAGLDRDFKGRVLRASHARIGMVFQEPRLLPWRTVEQNVRLAAPHADETTLSSVFDILELTAHRRHFPAELSLGLARRVALARAFAIDPEILVLDEPLASLDEGLAGRLREQIALLVAKHTVTTILVTHNLDDAVRLADRLFLLSSGPAGIASELSIGTPRRERTEAEISRIKLDIAQRIIRVRGDTAQPPPNQDEPWL